jgi:putative photosynthetic complex assembly protein
MSEHHHNQAIPRGVLIGAGVMILLSLGLAAGSRRAHLMAPQVALPPPIEVRQIRFEDRPDGAIAILDAPSGRQVSLVPPRSNGFIRGVLRGMFRTRKLESVGRQGEFRLAREADGRLSLTDPETGRRVDLDSFGPTNSQAFAQLLIAARQPSR